MQEPWLIYLAAGYQRRLAVSDKKDHRLALVLFPATTDATHPPCSQPSMLLLLIFYLNASPTPRPKTVLGQSCSLQDCSLDSSGHALPPKRACWVTVRVACCVPPPQLFEQAPKGPQSPTLQSTGHACVLQGCSLDSSGHALPPKRACWVTVRVACCVPPPQLFEQAPKGPQSPTLQSTGHACVLQGCSLDSSGHALPPKRACWVTVRVACCVPPPQLFEQAPKGPQSLTLQSTGSVSAFFAIVFKLDSQPR